MAFSSNRVSKGLILLLIGVFCLINVSISSPVFNGTHLRVKRQGCQDGTYKHEGRDCCLCAAGQRLKNHCTTSPDDRDCELCERGISYNSEPNSKESCEPCTSCSHENANLEVDESCTPYKDTKCKCKANHYCSSETCKICQPCDKCDATGVKEPCTATSNAVCNESKSLGGGEIAGIIIAVLVLLVLVAGAVYIKRQTIMKRLRPNSDSSTPSNHVDVPLLKVNMEPHLQDFAEILGWKDMKLVARKCDMGTAIENLEESHPKDIEDRTIELLKKWIERTGSNASVELIKVLRRNGKNNKADKIQQKLKEINSSSQSNSA
ncbi:tumor necrosis factor receptor superfamily member 6 [Cyprinodon tularosa]|uniref:tumor necrosis factor receptor superfamily member 6 n=1 Tax=Cyprinodon tularosa TaxID=77115 RepID=UPI0018E276CF|nr:tumor necrosis factor receptor superfamily member 6 [Cyprinodon tularosa]